MNADDVRKVIPTADEQWIEHILSELPRWDIDEPVRAAMFFAEFSEETAGFTKFEENLNYSADGLARTWPVRFSAGDIHSPNQKAIELAHNPEKIANEVYANRLGNGGPETGDGWMYRGRGPQLTGRANYRACGISIGQELEKYPELLLRPEIGAQAMCWFWYSRACNDFADARDLEGCTKKINGGLIGLPSRRAWYDKFCLALKAD